VDAAGGAPDASPAEIECGVETCSIVASEWCCVPTDGSTPVCSPTAGCSGYPVYCGGPEDCTVAGYPVCCFDEYGAYGGCVSADVCAQGQPEFWTVCHGNGDCPTGTSCQEHPTLQLPVCR